MSPSDATEYLTTRGKSFSRYISMWLHKFVHLMKYPKFFKLKLPWMTRWVSCRTNSIPPSDSALRTSAVAKLPQQRKISSLATDFISILSDMQERSRTIFWKSEEGMLMTEEKVTFGTSSSSGSVSIYRSFCDLHCLISQFSNFNPKWLTMPLL